LSTGSGVVPDLGAMLSAHCASGQQYFGHRKYYRRFLRPLRPGRSTIALACYGGAVSHPSQLCSPLVFLHADHLR
jgi:hypothetical protein